MLAEKISLGHCLDGYNKNAFIHSPKNCCVLRRIVVLPLSISMLLADNGGKDYKRRRSELPRKKYIRPSQPMVDVIKLLLLFSSLLFMSMVFGCPTQEYDANNNEQHCWDFVKC